VKGLNALLATVSTPLAAPVIAACRLRKGSTNSARGAARLVADALTAKGCGGDRAAGPAGRQRVLLPRRARRRRPARRAVLRHRPAGPQCSQSDRRLDPATAVETLIASGEGPHSEFKSTVPENPADIRNVIKTVAAFANGDGGTILFGGRP
jgi:hypothetical protein